jgi:hypothetical protein
MSKVSITRQLAALLLNIHEKYGIVDGVHLSLLDTARRRPIWVNSHALLNWLSEQGIKEEYETVRLIVGELVRDGYVEGVRDASSPNDRPDYFITKVHYWSLKLGFGL